MSVEHEDKRMTDFLTIPQIELTNQPHQAIEQVRHGRAVLVEMDSPSEPHQVAMLDARDFHLLQAVALYRAHASAPAYSPTAVPTGLTLDPADNNPQTIWGQVIAAYMDGQISLGRAAMLLGENRFQLMARFQRLGLPLPLEPHTIAEVEAEYNALS